MQVQFTRGRATIGTFRSQEVYTLSVVVQLTPEERRLIEKHDWLSAYVSNAAGVQLDDDHPLDQVRMSELAAGMELKSEKYGPLLNSEKVIVEAWQGVLETCEVLETFDGRTKVYEVTTDGHKLVA